MTMTDPVGPAATGPPRLPGRSSSLRQRLRAELGQDGARGALIAFISTLAVMGVLGIAIFTSESWPKVRDQFLNAEDFRESFPDVLGGFWLNIRLFLIAEVLILGFALLVAVIRSLRGPAFFPLRALAVIYIDLFRGVPLYLVIVLLGFGVPALGISWLPSSALVWATVALTLSYAAYTAEVYRAGIDSVHESQRSAARSIGLTQWQALRYAVLPQAVRNVIPALLNGLVSLQKDVALVSVIGVRDAVREAEIYTSRTFNYTSYVAAALLFLIISVPFARFTDWYAARDRARRSQAQL